MLEQELKATLTIAREAGEIILTHYHSDYDIELKTGEEPVTIADKESSAFIVEALRKAFPEDVIVSEEIPLPQEARTGKRIWVIDPVDGTKEFINKNGEFSVMIGLVIDQKPALGVVYQPDRAYAYWGVKGEGAYFQDGDAEPVRLAVSEIDQLNEVRLAASRSHLSQELVDLYEKLGIASIVQCGSVGLKCARIARDQSDLYLNLSGMTSAWDTCAPEVILAEAGGQVTDLSGQPLSYTFEHTKNRNGVVASNRKVHAKILAGINETLTQHSNQA